MPGALTSEEERAGIEAILIQITEGQFELDRAVAPAGDVRIVAMNRGEEAASLHLRQQGAPDSAAIGLEEIHPGDSVETVARLDEGASIVTATHAQGDQLSTATLTVQPQQGLPGSAENGAASRP